MSTSPQQAIGGASPHLALDPLADLPLRRPSRSLWTYLPLVISIAVFAAAIAQLRHLHVGDLATLLPRGPAFWLVFAGAYLAQPIADWIIFHRLWNLPAAGIVPLLRKFVANELVLGYSGELYFYAWARRHSRLTAAPFGAVKDVTVLSALTGNAATLLLLVLAFPLWKEIGLARAGGAVSLSVAFLLLTSVAMLLLRTRLFTLPRRELWMVAAVHTGRILLVTGLTALLWHLCLPAVGIAWWVLLATLRALVSRLAFLPNKDVAFAGIAVFLIGHDVEIGALMTLIAGLIVATHVAVGTLLAATELAERRAAR